MSVTAEDFNPSQSADDDHRLRRLPFAFAKRNGVVIEEITEQETRVAYKAGIKPMVIAELRRFIGMPITFAEVDEGEFDKRLALAYENDS
ncbi:MAG: hypothetical protein MI867_10245, partial [Pseudomonadales bacterium]|nr:hypothetical protein [Pseudomonadales bacterium]